MNKENNKLTEEEKDKLMLQEVWRNWGSYDRIDKLGEDD